ncbi:MAG: excinuclease ABC subunit UvrC [Deltaproteobacteria bacterium]|nr:excinuclease ABC subunit UvrC [Deltaproteobacteria bacterium]
MITEERLKDLPQFPGIYIMKGNKGEILYIGKAKNIRNRVRSYFREMADTRLGTDFKSVPSLASKISDIDCIITTNEKEALILEDTLLKKYKPRYNIRLKDDKTYVSIKLALTEKFPRILITRQIKKDGSRSPLKPAPACFKRGACGDKYFGPYASAQKARETVRFIRRIFPLCSCSLSEFVNRIRPCIDYQLGICSAPCVNLISVTDYRKLADKTIMFLEGKNRELLSELKASMMEASSAFEFEKAAKVRDQIKAIEATLEEQKVVSPEKIDRDIFAHTTADESLLIQALFVRDGRVSGARDFYFKNQEFPRGGTAKPFWGRRRSRSIWLEEAISSFLSQYYSGDRFIPDEVIVSLAIEDKEAIEGWLTGKKGKRIKIFSPIKGDRLKLLKMAEANAKEAIKRRQAILEGKQTLLEGLKKRLRLKRIPKMIEAFDISNIGGKMAVGAMATFEGGKPNKERYRLYRIQGKEEPDDYGMMREVLSRRYKKPAPAGFEQGAIEEAGLPDLILVDGGRGQMNIAVNVLRELGIEGVDIAAIAKEHPPLSPLNKGGIKGGISGEKVYLPHVKDPIILKQGSPPDLFIRRVRDEVHRFAISYHKKLRGKIKSILDVIPGIGKAKRNMLLKRFGSIENIKEAAAEDIAKIPGITTSLAEVIKSALQQNNG